MLDGSFALERGEWEEEPTVRLVCFKWMGNQDSMALLNQLRPSTLHYGFTQAKSTEETGHMNRERAREFGMRTPDVFVFLKIQSPSYATSQHSPGTGSTAH